MEEIVYSAESQLLAPRRFIHGAFVDLRASPSAASSSFLRNLQAQYRQSWLGYIWLLLPPIATTLVWVYLNAAHILNVGQTTAPYPVYVLTGTILWQVFAESLTCPLRQLSAAREILTKTRIPHEALVLAGLYEVVFNFTVRFAITLPVYFWLRSPLRLEFLLAPLGVISLLLLGLTIGLLLTPLGLLYQDVSRSLNIIIGFWFLLTPVIYPAPAKGLAALLVRLNPVTPILVTTRDWLTLSVVAPTPGFASVIAASVMCLIGGWLIYRLAKPHLISRL